ncbi:MAG: SMP-30/gluconolactonase/LRE family protein [Polaromonas sp.]|nr:SMP-30/gluconolactonase/LRE family protein [Polaromonas sp.]
MTPGVQTDPATWQRLIESLRADAPVSKGEGLGSLSSGLQRPECVLTHSSGHVFVSDLRGGVSKIQPNGATSLIGGQTLSDSVRLLPNGFAMRRDGSFLVANLGEQGGVWCIEPGGAASPWLTEVDGRTVHRVNFVVNDQQGRVWVCISATDGSDAYPLRNATGYIVLCDAVGIRVVADGLHYTNECRVSADGRFLYVNETFGRRLSRFRIGPHGELTAKETLATFCDGDFPDGLALDSEGGAWVVCVGSNRLYRIAPDGTKLTVIDDSVTATTQALDAAFVAGTLNRPQLSSARGHRLHNVTSIAFGGADLRTAYMGCLAGDTLATFRSPVAGVRPVHWSWP